MGFRVAEDARAKAMAAKTEAQKSLEAVSDALAGVASAQQSVTTEVLHSLAVSRLDRWQQAHSDVGHFQVHHVLAEQQEHCTSFL